MDKRSFNRKALVGVCVVPRLVDYKWVSREERIRRQMAALSDEAIGNNDQHAVQFLLEGRFVLRTVECKTSLRSAIE